MNILKFTKISENDTLNNIVWHNLLIADKNLHLSAFIAASMGYLKANPEKNYQELEQELRDKNLNTYLIAKDNPNIPDAVLKFFNKEDNSDIKYQCVMSCRPPPYALYELLEYSKSYKENFKKLKYAGDIHVITKEKPKNNDITFLNDEEIDNMERI